MSEDILRAYDPERDLDAVLRIWMEVGWLESAEKRPTLEAFLAAGQAEVAEMDGVPECAVHWSPGTIRYQNTSLPLCAVTAVTTSHIGRKRGFASRMTARALQQGAEAGCAVAALGMFEQGFYDRLGFGTGCYESIFAFDPSSLDVKHVPYRTPVRLTSDHWRDMHAALAGTLPAHGAVRLDSAEFVRGELGFPTKPFAFGYRDDAGALTHFVLGDLEDEYGPFRVIWMAYRSTSELLELLRLLHELSDQFRTVKMAEPPHVQLQALLREPIRDRDRTRGAKGGSQHESIAWMQLRILDVARCIAARRFPGPDVRFNLTLEDPLAGCVEGGWAGISGAYTVTIGTSSTVSEGHTEGLPVLEADVSAFSRLWLGVRPATTLAVSDHLEAPRDLLEALDEAFCLPRAKPGMEF